MITPAGITCKHIVVVRRKLNILAKGKGNVKKVECGKLMIEYDYCRYRCSSGHISVYPVDEFDGQAVLGKIKGVL